MNADLLREAAASMRSRADNASNPTDVADWLDDVADNWAVVAGQTCALSVALAYLGGAA